MMRPAPWQLVALAVLLLGLLLAPEAPPVEVHVSDLVLHLSLVRGLEANRTLDFWHPVTDLGYPVLRLYQPLWHLAIAGADTLTAGQLGIEWWAHASIFLLALAAPLGTFLGTRRWLAGEGLEDPPARWIAAIAALLGALATSFTSFGYDPLQVLSTRHAVLTQTWATVFFLPAFAWAVGWLRGSVRSPGPALALAALVWGFSLIIGLLLLAAVAFRAALEAWFERQRGLPALGRRAAVYLLGLALATAWLGWPLAADVPWVHYPERFFDPWVKNGFGLGPGLGHLFSGRLLDGQSLTELGRLPVMSLLFAFGLLRLGGPLARLPRARAFLLGGQLLWLSFFIGRGAWGGLLYALPLLRSYQWFRFEALFQMMATLIAAVGVYALAITLRRKVIALALPVFALLLWHPLRLARNDARWLGEVERGGAQRLLREIGSRLEGDPTRLYVGGPTTWERELVAGGVWPGVAVIARGQESAGRIYQGMGLSAQLQYLWDGKSEWGQELLGIGNLLAPCARMAELSVHSPGVELFPGVCLALTRRPPPLGWLSRRAAQDPVALGEDDLLDRQRAALAGGRADVFLPFRLGGARGRPPGGAPPPLPEGRIRGARFGFAAPGRAEAVLELEVAEAPAAVVFPVPYHPALAGFVDGAEVAPHPVVPGYAAVKVGPGRHVVELVYAPGRGKDLLFLTAALAALLGLVHHRIRRAGPA